MSIEILSKAEAEQEAELGAITATIAKTKEDLLKISDDLKPEVAAEKRAALLKTAELAVQGRGRYGPQGGATQPSGQEAHP